jgi:hypothetical protein
VLRRLPRAGTTNATVKSKKLAKHAKCSKSRLRGALVNSSLVVDLWKSAFATGRGAYRETVEIG